VTLRKDKFLGGAALLLMFLATRGLAQTWIQLAPTGGPPASRYLPTGVYDTATNQMIVFGGTDRLGSNFNDLWALSLGPSPQWTLLSPGGTVPSPRVGHKTVYDGTNARMVLFGGGLGQTSPCANDVWVLSNANGVGGTPTWTQLSPSGPAPAGRFVSSAVYDAASNRMTIFGGNDCFSGFYNDVWVLSNANGLGGTPAWTQLTPTGTPPSQSGYQAAVYDPGSNRMIVWGTLQNPGTFSIDQHVWVLTNANGLGGTPTWIQLAPAGSAIPDLGSLGAVYDVLSNRMTAFGGGNASGDSNGVWVLANANGLGGTPTWIQLTPSGTLPAPRDAMAVVYDAASNRMTIFAGYSDTIPAPNVLNDAWVLTNANGAHQFTGFLAPLTNGVLNQVRAGQSVPVKWQLQDSTGNFLTALSTVTGTSSANLGCGSESIGAEVPTDASGASGLRYDSTANQFVYSWKTEKSWVGTCRRFLLSLDDGSTHTVDFSFN
jgi:galactose oxidase-like protein